MFSNYSQTKLILRSIVLCKHRPPKNSSQLEEQKHDFQAIQGEYLRGHEAAEDAGKGRSEMRELEEIGFTDCWILGLHEKTREIFIMKIQKDYQRRKGC